MEQRDGALFRRSRASMRRVSTTELEKIRHPLALGTLHEGEPQVNGTVVWRA